MILFWFYFSGLSNSIIRKKSLETTINIKAVLVTSLYSNDILVLFQWIIKLGPVVQSVVSLTSSLRVILLTVLADSIHNILIFFAEKM